MGKRLRLVLVLLLFTVIMYAVVGMFKIHSKTSNLDDIDISLAMDSEESEIQQFIDVGDEV